MSSGENPRNGGVNACRIMASHSISSVRVRESSSRTMPATTTLSGVFPESLMNFARAAMRDNPRLAGGLPLSQGFESLLSSKQTSSTMMRNTGPNYGLDRIRNMVKKHRQIIHATPENAIHPKNLV